MFSILVDRLSIGDIRALTIYYNNNGKLYLILLTCCPQRLKEPTWKLPQKRKNSLSKGWSKVFRRVTLLSFGVPALSPRITLTLYLVNTNLNAKTTVERCRNFPLSKGTEMNFRTAV